MRRSLVSLIMAVLAVTMIGACSVKESGDVDGVTTDATPDAGSTGSPLFGDVDESDDTGVDTESSGTDSTGSGSGESGNQSSSTPSTEPLAIETDKLPDATQSKTYMKKLVGDGGSGQYKWIAASGLPANGLELSGRRIKGIPENAGEFTIKITLKDEVSSDTVSKSFNLIVLPKAPDVNENAVKESLRIKVEKLGSDGKWSEVTDLSDTVNISKYAQRLRLSVLRSDGGMPSSPRFYWQVVSPEQRLATFVSPYLEKEGEASPPEAQQVYLMPWSRKGLASITQYDLEVRASRGEIDLSGTRVTVGDDYGNKTQVVFEKIEIGGDSGEFRIEVPEEVRVDFGSVDSEQDQAYSPWDFAVMMVGGTPPYSLKIEKNDACKNLAASKRKEYNYELNNCMTDGHDWYWVCDSSSCWHFELSIDAVPTDPSQFRVKQAVGPNDDGILRSRMVQKGSSCATVAYVNLTAQDSAGAEVTAKVPLVLDFRPFVLEQDLGLQSYCSQ